MDANLHENTENSLESGLIKQVDLSSKEMMPGDAWLLSSVMQKAIRRGDVSMAGKAAHSLWMQDRQRLWRRLHIIALEDVGIGDVEAVNMTLQATANAHWRRKVGDDRVAVFLAQKLAASLKNRWADEMTIYLDKHDDLRDWREYFALTDDESLITYIEDEEEKPEIRCLALWYLAGMKRYPSDHMPARSGSVEVAESILMSIHGESPLTQNCCGVLRRSPWPIALFMPIFAQWAERSGREFTIVEQPLHFARNVEGIPLYAADMFTRVGQAAYRVFRSNVRELKWFSVKQIGIALFYLEGGCVNLLRTNQELDLFRTTAELTDAYGVGLEAADYMTLKAICREHMPMLQQIRAEHLERYFFGG